jgi:uncharacterized protein (DUF2252 family)
MTPVVDRIYAFNSDRIPDRVALKYQEMAQDLFSFLRGTCHLFYEDLHASGELRTAPAVWSCGDLHLQNFGTFKGDANPPGSPRKLVYFDINDFDDAALIPSSWDLVRFVTSIRVANLTKDPQESIALAQHFLTTYAQTLRAGKACVLYRENSTGVVKDLLQTLRKRDRADFLKKRLQRKTRALLRTPNKVLTATPDELHTIQPLIQTWAKTQSKPEFFHSIDIAARIAGNGSLGLARYLILVQGNGYPEGCYLLDLKATRPSSIAPYFTLPQPHWTSEADRIVQLQTRLQASPPALLSPIETPAQSYVLRELQPTNDKLDLTALAHQPTQAQHLIKTLAELVAWGHLRSSGRQGSAIADQLIAFAQEKIWQTEILTYAHHYHNQIKEDYQDFLSAQLVKSSPTKAKT